MGLHLGTLSLGGTVVAGGETGGTIAINTVRSDLQCAPDSVRFRLDLSAASFDKAAPTGSEIYDERQHDWVVIWGYGDDSDTAWTAPTNVLTTFKNRNTQIGWEGVHMYRAPGTYTVTVWVLEMSSGKTASASTSVTVLDPDDVFPTTKTVCVSTSGDFTGAPAGATQVTASTIRDADTHWNNNNDASNPVRWLFCGGETFDVEFWIDADVGAGVMFGAYGTGNAIWAGEGDGYFAAVYLASAHGSAAMPDLRFERITFTGNYDPVTENQSVSSAAKDLTAFRSARDLNTIVSQCTFTGWMSETWLQEATDETKERRMHFDDCLVTNFGGQYPFIIYANYLADSLVAFTGCRMTQNPNAVNDPGIRATIRVQGSSRTIIDGSDFFITTTTQMCVKFEETPTQDGGTVQAARSSFEGGLHQISFGNNAHQSPGVNRGFAVNAVFDSCIFVANYGTQYCAISRASGLTFRNSIFVLPSLNGSNATGYGNAAVNLAPFGTFGADVAAAKVRLYNCTLRNERTTTENGGVSTALLSYYKWGTSDFTDYAEENNINHSPNLSSPLTASAPVTSVAMFTPRTLGDRDPSTYVQDTTLASDAVVYDTKPDTGSAALGGATSGLVAYDDVSGVGAVVREDAASVDDGAWQVTA